VQANPFGKRAVRFSQFGNRRFDRARGVIDDAARLAAYFALDDYRSQKRNVGVPGIWHTARGRSATGGMRYPPTGHPMESDRMYFHDVLLLPTMGRVGKFGPIWRAFYGNKQMLDDMKPMYYRGAREDSDSEWQPQQLVIQEGPPIWTMIEYGTPRHDYGPRPDRQWMRFIWFRRDYAEAYAHRVDHPGAFRNNAIFQRVSGGWAVSPSVWRKSRRFWAQNMLGIMRAGEAFGAAPFRRSQMAVQTAGPGYIHNAVRLAGRL